MTSPSEHDQREDDMTTGKVMIELEGVNKMVHAGFAGARMNHGGANR